MHEACGIETVDRRDGDTDAGLDEHPVATSRKGLSECLDDALGEKMGCFRLFKTDLEDCEFVASVPGDRILQANRCPKTPARFDKQFISHCMAKRIVHGFETVKVKAKNGKQQSSFVLGARSAIGIICICPE